MTIDLNALEATAQRVTGWKNCNAAWLDTSEDESAAVVGSIDEDGRTFPVATIDCDQYYAGEDSLPLAKFYAAANPATVLELVRMVKQRDELLAALELCYDHCRLYYPGVESNNVGESVSATIASVKGGAA